MSALRDSLEALAGPFLHLRGLDVLAIGPFVVTA